jgi:hypothetical protein
MICLTNGLRAAAVLLFIAGCGGLSQPCTRRGEWPLETEMGQ